MEDPRKVVQKRCQRVHHTEVLYSPWYGQHQSPIAPGFLQIAENVKLNWYLERKGFALINLFLPSSGRSAGQPVGWSVSQAKAVLLE